MSFQAYEESSQSGSRIEITTLSLGNSVYRMHNSVEPELTYDTNTYFRTQISRGSITTGQEYLEIELPGSHEFSREFATIAPGRTATLTIQSWHREDPSDVITIYKGVVRAVAFTQQAAVSKLSVIPLSEAFDKEIPERTFQASCNNVLFDNKCQVSSGLFSYENTVSAINDNIVTVSGLESAKGTGWSTGGYVALGVLDYRLILEQDGDDLILVLPFHETVLGQNVTVYAGCDHTAATCQSKFNNGINFGGCPYVPTLNIFIHGIK